MRAFDAGDLELERRFESFARARLSPDPAAVARIRARVMREARFHHEAARIVAHMAPAIEARQRSTLRRIGMPLLAAVVWLAIAVGTIAAAHAGGPLYPTRLWLENATVPTNGSARVTAELDRLESRVEEVLEAANNGDVQGVAAALDAYAAIAADATAAGSGDPVQLARVEQALANHVAVLTAVAAGLSDRGNDTAADAVERNIERAIAHSAAVIANLAAHQGGPAAGTPLGGGGAGAGGAGNAYGAGQGGGNAYGAGQGGGNINDGTGSQGAAAPSATAEPTVTTEPTATPEPSAAAGGGQGAGGQGPGTGGGQGAGGQGPGTGGGQGGGPNKPSASPDASQRAPHSSKR